MKLRPAMMRPVPAERMAVIMVREDMIVKSGGIEIAGRLNSLSC